MSISELRCFNAVALHGSFSNAANKIGRAQPTVTLQVSNLEKSYGVLLFDRKRGRKVRITPFGERLFEITSRLFALETDAINHLKDGADLVSGSLRIGASAPTEATRCIAAFRKLNSSIEISMSFGNSRQILNMLRSSEIDVAFLGGDGSYSDCDCVPISNPEVVLLCSETHHASLVGEISLASLEDEVLLIREKGSQTRDLFERFLDENQCKPKAIIEVGSREGVCSAAAAGLGLGVIVDNEILPRFDTQALRISNHRVSGQTFAICLKDRSFAAAVRAFMNSTRR